jgi:hypothetical protein
MGLDQYLYAKRYASRTPGFGEDVYQAVIEATNADFADPEWGGMYVEVCVGYWRKSNQIHQWFVDNCQGGVDDCREAHVSREQLVELRNLCEQVLLAPATASKALPTTSGFFFGSTEYDEYYFSDLKDTIKIIDRALSVPQEWDFTYSSSW